MGDLVWFRACDLVSKQWMRTLLHVGFERIPVAGPALSYLRLTSLNIAMSLLIS